MYMYAECLGIVKVEKSDADPGKSVGSSTISENPKD